MTSHEPSSAFIPGSHLEAARGLVSWETMRTPKFLNRLHDAPTVNADPLIFGFARAFLGNLHRRGWPFYAHVYWRSDEEQARLKAARRSKAGPGQSPHNFGMAVDIVHVSRGWDLSRKEWDVIGMVGKEVIRTGFYSASEKRMLRPKIEWGGDWKFYDPAHWEIAAWRERAASVASKPSPSSFSEAFSRARAARLDVFEWNGKSYSTKLAD